VKRGGLPIVPPPNPAALAYLTNTTHQNSQVPMDAAPTIANTTAAEQPNGDLFASPDTDLIDRDQTHPLGYLQVLILQDY
jgi:hypothetical protein